MTKLTQDENEMLREISMLGIESLTDEVIDDVDNREFDVHL